jgi:hypothetical protein
MELVAMSNRFCVSWSRTVEGHVGKQSVAKLLMTADRGYLEILRLRWPNQASPDAGSK